MMLSHSMSTWPMAFWTQIRIWWNFHNLLISLRNETPENFSIFDERSLEIWPLEILTYSALVWFLRFGPFLRACNSVGSKDCMNLKFSVLNNLTKDWQKTDIGKIYSWLPHWLSKIEKKTHLFSDFCHIVAPKYQTNCQIILNTYSFYTNTTIMEQIKPSIL